MRLKLEAHMLRRYIGKHWYLSCNRIRKSRLTGSLNTSISREGPVPTGTFSKQYTLVHYTTVQYACVLWRIGPAKRMVNLMLRGCAMARGDRNELVGYGEGCDEPKKGSRSNIQTPAQG